MSLTYDIVNNVGELPKEIQEIILSYIPINILTNINKKELESFIENYIKNYIKYNLLSNIPKSEFLLTLPKYSEMLKTRLRELSLSYARDFMKNINKYSVGEPINIFEHMNIPITTISFKIEFKSKEGYPYRGVNSMALSISNDIYSILLMKLQDNDITTNITSIKLIKTFYPTGINENNKEEILIVYK
jgi:hypothetical protein